MASVVDDISKAGRPDKSAVKRLFDDTRKRLIETGTRNRLVHVNRKNTRATVVNVVNERSEDVYRILGSGKVMRFLAIGRDKDAEDNGLNLADAGEPGFDAERYTDAQLETRMGPDALQKRLLKIAREAQTAEEESGINILYLALGFLTWFEDKISAVQREAPLILLPVQLTRNQRTNTYDIRLRDDDIVTNLPLQQRLKEDFGLVLPELEIDEAWSPSSYLEQVESAVASQDSWRVDRDGMQLGFFSFSKLLMYRDLAPDAWPDGAISEHNLTRGLLYEGFEPEPPLIGRGDRLDTVLPPENIFHVVDADASQAIVIEEVRQGRNLVVQGPPGTGKSQTITNIIAAAVKEGKRVLFVAEKMAALSVVHDRLVKVGLQDMCIELHSRTANKKDVLAELARTMMKASAVPSMPGPPASLTKVRDKLNALAAVLHQPIGSSGETPYSVLGIQSRFIGMNVPAPAIDSRLLAAMSREQMDELLHAVDKYGELLVSEGQPEPHPLAGVQNLALQPVALSRLATQLSNAGDAVAALNEALMNATTVLGVELPPTRASSRQLLQTLGYIDALPVDAEDIASRLLAEASLDRLTQALQAGAVWRVAKGEAKAQFVDAAFDASPVPLRGALSAGAQSFFARWGGAYRSASRELAGMLRGSLPKSPKDRLALLDKLIDIDDQKKRWKADESYCAKCLGEAWRGELTDFNRLLSISAWCEKARQAPLGCPSEVLVALGAKPEVVKCMKQQLAQLEPAAETAVREAMNVLQFTPSVLGDEEPAHHELPRVRDWLKLVSSSTDKYPGWSALQKAHAAMVRAGLPDVAARMRAGTLPAEQAVTELRFARAEHLWSAARETSPQLRDISELDRHQLVEEFTALERERLKDNVTSIVAGHLAQVPQGAMGEMKIIRGEIGKKRGHIALRKLFSSAGNALQRIKPVMLMSPISVAQYIPPGALSFDLLIIDEASQVRPEDALGAIARAKQIVVVGDQKQLPPSSFFARLLSDEAEDETDEDGEENLLGDAAKVVAMESILSLCEARGLNSRMLRWHYRSRDPSLIQVSNREFYDDQLILPPSPLQKNPNFGLTFTRVPGVYDKGGKRDNRIEGEVIVTRLAEHARSHPDVSVGIVTFSSAQKNLITELLELRRRTDTVLNDFLREGNAESVFVKNIENVQGDERDVIFVSVCYGPTLAGGRLASMSFGPVNSEGGERRLNVLFTRARLKCEVFASFHPSDIDPGRSARDGVRILKHYLEFADGAPLSGVASFGGTADSPFEEDVANVIRSLGYLADHQVGTAGFRIDLGVRHPDRPGAYLLAVECDGATYHSALWARERDRLRQDVLEHLGWRFYRIWSTDWFYNRKNEIERLRTALANAHQAAEQAIRLEGANKTRPVAPLADQIPPMLDMPEAALRQMPAYKRYVIAMGAQEPHEVPLQVVVDLVTRIVQEEGPIHVEEAARRLAFCFDKEKAGSRIVGTTKSALEKAQTQGADLLTDGTFWYTSAHVDDTPVRDRSNESGATLKAASLSMLEVMAALRIARADNAGGEDSELIRSAARLLGFKRVGAELQERLASGLTAAKQSEM
ncbi:DUF3320 domain-containing protein [Massilia sp. LXY-6]|uniref:DUF3320 domain-containing protein n=1 Tax=Massilia sp. LXY-6 TaxID=3379823 RepID=UPI003EE2A05D